MAVTRKHLQNAFNITIEDEITDTDDISKTELTEFQTQFNNLLDLLKQEANEEPIDED